MTRALIADDEPLLARGLNRCWPEAWPDSRLRPVPNGLEALEAAERLLPEVAFLDIQMPGMMG